MLASKVRYSSIVGSSIMLADDTEKCIGILALLNVENKTKEDEIIDFVINAIDEKNKKTNFKMLRAEPFIDGDDFSIILKDDDGAQLIQLHLQQFSDTFNEDALERLLCKLSYIINEEVKKDRSKNAIGDLFE